MRPTIVILNYNGGEWLQRCLQSLGTPEHVQADVVVVDNGSTDGSADAAESEFKWVRVMRNAANLGFAAGCNVGIEAALDAGADWIVLLNPDTRVEAGWLDELLTAGAAMPRAGILAPLQLEYDSDEPNSWTRTALVAVTDLSSGSLDSGGVIEVDQVEGSSMAVRRDVFERAGLLDTVYGSFFEDYDLCRRARYLGFRVAVVTRSRVHHARSAIWNATTARARERWYRCERGQFIFAVTDAKLPAAGSAWRYVVSLASKLRELLAAPEAWRIAGFIRLQGDLLSVLPVLVRKVRRDRALIRQAASTELRWTSQS